VLLVHGWGSSPARFNEIVEKLCSQGYSVIGFDQPGHGLTGGTFVSLVDIAKAVGDLSKVYGPFQAVVAHSLGALAAGLVCAESKIAEKLVLVSPLTGSDAAVETFGMLTGIEQPVLAGMRVSIENELGIDFRQYNFEKLIGLIREDLLVIHDKDDRLTSAEKSAEWVGKSTDAEFLLTNGLGHRRILRDPEVVEAVAGFLGRARADVRQQMFSDYAL
jgi:pimeloyl-ACP methyl ester carboxylesterase